MIWYLLSVAVVVIVFIAWTAFRPSIGLTGERASDKEIRMQLLEEFESQFAARFPGREFQTDFSELTLQVPNENGSVPGVLVSIDDPYDLTMFIQGGGIHWHFFDEIAPRSKIELLLTELDNLFCDRIFMYEGKSVSGMYRAGEKPAKLDRPGYLVKHWVWSGSLPI